MTRTDIIQTLIDRGKLTSYLEIGTQNKNNNFNKINCKEKFCVDPDPAANADYIMTSDKFFSLCHGRKFDVIFIDGLHEEKQVINDMNNALQCLNIDGYIVVHDCNPSSEEMQRVPRVAKQWTGDVWKAWVQLRERPGLDMKVVDTDFGCGIIKFGYNNTLLGRQHELTYDNLEKFRKQWLNLISVDVFKILYHE